MRRYVQIGKKIIGVGLNYHGHIKEMGSAIPSEPIFFLKPTSSYVIEPDPIRIPEGVKVHHECNLNFHHTFHLYKMLISLVLFGSGVGCGHWKAWC